MLALGLAIPLLLHGFGVAHALARHPLPAALQRRLLPRLGIALERAPATVPEPLSAPDRPDILAPVDVTLSVWFFLLLNKLELLGTAVTGWSEGRAASIATPPYLEEQSAGAYLALAAVLVWMRKHLTAIARSLFSRRGAAVVETEVQRGRSIGQAGGDKVTALAIRRPTADPKCEVRGYRITK